MDIYEYIETISELNTKAGGGSVGAFSGAMASSLVIKAYRMVARKDPDLDLKVGDNFIHDLERLKNYFKEMIMADGKIYARVLEAQKLPMNSQEEIAYKEDKVEEAYKDALQSPYDMMIHVIKIYDYIYRLKDHSTPAANTELYVAKNQIVACFNSAKVNVAINMKSIKDKEYLNRKRDNILTIEQNYVYNTKKFDILFKK